MRKRQLQGSQSYVIPARTAHELSPGRDAGRGPALVLACSILAGRAGGLLHEGVGAASDDGKKADALGRRRVERAVTGKASRGCYCTSHLRWVLGPFTMSVIHG